MTYNPYCPHCAVELDFDDHYDMYDDGDAIIVKCIMFFFQTTIGAWLTPAKMRKRL